MGLLAHKGCASEKRFETRVKLLGADLTKVGSSQVAYSTGFQAPIRLGGQAVAANT